MAQLAEQKYEQVPVNSIRPHPQNPRKGDTHMIAQSIESNTFYGALIVQRSTGYILAGSHRWHGARVTGLETVPVFWLDVDDAQAKRIMLADNRSSDVAEYDNHVLVDVIKEINEQYGNLVGTLYDPLDLQDLVRQVTPPPMPDFEDDGAVAAPQRGGNNSGGRGGSASGNWKQIKVRVPGDVHSRWSAIVDEYDGDEGAALIACLEALEGLEAEEGEGDEED